MYDDGCADVGICTGGNHLLKWMKCFVMRTYLYFIYLFRPFRHGWLFREEKKWSQFYIFFRNVATRILVFENISVCNIMSLPRQQSTIVPCTLNYFFRFCFDFFITSSVIIVNVHWPRSQQRVPTRDPFFLLFSALIIQGDLF